MLLRYFPPKLLSPDVYTHIGHFNRNTCTPPHSCNQPNMQKIMQIKVNNVEWCSHPHQKGKNGILLTLETVDLKWLTFFHGNLGDPEISVLRWQEWNFTLFSAVVPVCLKVWLVSLSKTLSCSWRLKKTGYMGYTDSLNQSGHFFFDLSPKQVTLIIFLPYSNVWYEQ